MSTEIEKATDVLMRVESANRINCTGLGEVGCVGQEGWHSWSAHRRHVAESQVAALVDAGLLPASSEREGQR